MSGVGLVLWLDQTPHARSRSKNLDQACVALGATLPCLGCQQQAPWPWATSTQPFMPGSGLHISNTWFHTAALGPGKHCCPLSCPRYQDWDLGSCITSTSSHKLGIKSPGPVLPPSSPLKPSAPDVVCKAMAHRTPHGPVGIILSHITWSWGLDLIHGPGVEPCCCIWSI